MNLTHLYKVVLVCLIISHSSKAKETQQFNHSVFSGGIGNYLQYDFDAIDYTEDYLPNNFFHFIELLKHGLETGKNRAYFKSVLRLFADKIVRIPYRNAYDFNTMLVQLPPLLEVPFAVKNDLAFTSLKDIIYEIQYQQFKANFSLFKSSPETFLENLSQEIEDASELRKLLFTFLQLSITKLIWSPEDNIATWHNVRHISDQLAVLHQKHIIADQDDLNSLYITLLERYCFFLDLAGSSMDIVTFERIKEDVSTNRINLLELEEQEELIETKMHRFTRCLADVEAKARAYDKGLVTR